MDCQKQCAHNHWRCEACKRQHDMLKVAARELMTKIKLYVHRVGLKRIGTYRCEVCGSLRYVEAHHDSYLRPTHVRWLCRKHHRLHHAQERAAFVAKFGP